MDQKVRIGILSTAEIAHKVCQSIQLSKNAVVYAVASRSKEKAAKWANEHQIDISYGTYDELITDPNVDGIYIPLPTLLKKEWAIKAAQNKKPILLEKPMPGQDTDQDVLDIINACEQNNVQFLDGTMWLHSLRTQVIAEKKKELGKISVINAFFTFKAPNEEWLQGGNGRTNKNQEPQGTLGDQGWYPVGAILFGYDYEQPVSVKCVYSLKNKIDTYIQFSGFLEFTGGRLAYFETGYTLPHRSHYEMIGENGAIRVDDQVGGQRRTGNFQAYFENFTGSDRFYQDDVLGKETIIPTEPSNHTKLMVEKFAELIQSKQIDKSWPNKSLMTHRVLAALFRSAEEGNKTIFL